jgi:branched-chain amino acid transport system substrate-binding protein
MKKLVVLPLIAVLGVVAAGSGGASTQSPAAAGSALIRCGKTRQIGVAAPITGPAASLGQQQLRWAKFFVSRWNRSHAKKFRLVQGDTQLPNTSQAIKVAQQFASNSKILGTVGPAGSQEVLASVPVFKKRGLGAVSGSSTATKLTDGRFRGFFWRVVGNDAVQGAAVAKYITGTLKVKKVMIVDDQEAYGVGLSDIVQKRLRAARVAVKRDSVNPATTSDFSSIVAKIDRATRIVYLPWQLASKAQLFGQQMREQGKTAKIFGSDGLFDPSSFTVEGAYISVWATSKLGAPVPAYKRKYGKGDFFGAPTYIATQVVANAVNKACRNGKASRAEVRRNLARTSMRSTLFGRRISFTAKGDVANAPYFIWRVIRGKYVQVK